VVDINSGRSTARFSANGASLSPDGRFIASFSNFWRCEVSITSSIISHTAVIYSKPITTIAFSPDSTRLLAMAEDSQVHILDLEALHRDDSVDILSTFPPDRMIVQLYQDRMTYDGWFYGRNGARLLWLPHDTRKVLLMTGIEDCRLFVQYEGSNVAVLDMKDYSKVPQVGRSWRKGGIRFVDNEWEVSLARFLERLSVTQELTWAGEKRQRDMCLEDVGSPGDEQAKRLRLKL
jgi:hypothetical protein